MAKKIRELKDIEAKEISLVDKSANKKKFLFFKARGEGRGAGGSAQTNGAKYCVCSECGYSEEHEKKGEGKSVPCTKIRCPECGTLMRGSDTKVLKKKKSINIVIDSDGTVGGTKIVVNKKALGDLRDFNFSFWSSDLDVSKAVSCSYSKFVETADGFNRSETFYLSKGDFVMDAGIKKQLETYFGEDEEVDFEKAAKDDDIIKSLETINEYREDFPDDLKKAVGVVAKQAAMYESLAAESDDKDNKEDVEKAGAKFSKETLVKLKALVAAMKALEEALPKEGTEKSDKGSDEKDELKAEIDKLSKAIEQIEKKKGNETKDKLTETLKDLTARLATVEKGTGIKKGEDGQEDDNDDDSDVKDEFPSLKII